MKTDDGSLIDSLLLNAFIFSKLWAAPITFSEIDISKPQYVKLKLPTLLESAAGELNFLFPPIHTLATVSSVPKLTEFIT